MRYFILLISCVLYSCSDNATLQTYFVENSESTEFFTIDITPSILKTDALTLTNEETAPLGCENGFFLVPIAPGLEDTEELRELYFDKITLKKVSINLLNNRTL